MGGLADAVIGHGSGFSYASANRDVGAATGEQCGHHRVSGSEYKSYSLSERQDAALTHALMMYPAELFDGRMKHRSHIEQRAREVQQTAMLTESITKNAETIEALRERIEQLAEGGDDVDERGADKRNAQRTELEEKIRMLEEENESNKSDISKIEKEKKLYADDLCHVVSERTIVSKSEEKKADLTYGTYKPDKRRSQEERSSVRPLARVTLCLREAAGQLDLCGPDFCRSCADPCVCHRVVCVCACVCVRGRTCSFQMNTDRNISRCSSSTIPSRTIRRRARSSSAATPSCCMNTRLAGFCCVVSISRWRARAVT